MRAILIDTVLRAAAIFGMWFAFALVAAILAQWLELDKHWGQAAAAFLGGMCAERIWSNA